MHAAWVDPKATGIDFLRCTIYENDTSQECRQRRSDHVALIRQTWFEIVGEWHTVDGKALAALPGKRWRNFFDPIQTRRSALITFGSSGVNLEIYYAQNGD
jgi:hypothetical protein